MNPATLLGFAFPPLALMLGHLFLRLFHPRLRNMPLGTGVACLLVGAVGAWAVIGDVSAGVVHYRTRALGGLEASAARSPWVFWDEILLLYALSLGVTAFGVAVLGRAWRRARRR
ncbi:hypothetical protein [Stenotrophomonas panacihumi]|uniref:hypothetical protein n=1 Tax=Stenotrophomonas panacihumi TaxID=676599 RepID=UPI0011B1EAB4|nr:hypothetical protein [Stenotrophomonas panacihumi]